MKIDNQNQYGSLSSEVLADFESQLGVKLPQDYRDHLLKYNGGDPRPNTFDISPDEGQSNVHNLYGLHDGPYYSNLREVVEVFKGRIPNGLLPISGDDGGNIICLGLSKKYLGKIYFWDHEKESSFFKSVALTLIAPSFSTFMAGLYEYIDPSESTIDKIIRLEDIEALTELLDKGFDFETQDEHSRTPIEVCAIHRKHAMIRFLFAKGAKLGSSLALAQSNAEFFPEHHQTVKLIKALEAGTDIMPES